MRNRFRLEEEKAMKVSMLTFSQTGNTLKVGAAIADALESEGWDVDHLRFRHRETWRPHDADVVGVGCPCFESLPAENVPRFLDSSGLRLTGKKAFVYITSGGSPAKTLWHLAQAVRRTGAEVVGGVQIRGTSTVPTMFALCPERPNTDDLAHATEFGLALVAHLQRGESLARCFCVDRSNGGSFYNAIGPILAHLKKAITPPPRCDQEKCNGCGICVEECPQDNFAIENGTLKVRGTCMVCFRCWHVCPKNAISIRFSPGRGWLERHLYSEAMERRFGNLEIDEIRGPNLYREALSRRIKLRFNRRRPTAEYRFVGDGGTAERAREETSHETTQPTTTEPTHRELWLADPRAPSE